MAENSKLRYLTCERPIFADCFLKEVIFTNSKYMSVERCVVDKSKHDVMKIADDVSTLMMLMSLYHCNEKRLGLKFSKFYVFLEI